MFRLTDQSILPEECRKYFEDNPAFGALCVFEGIVRNNNDGKNVSSLFYEAHKELCESEAQKIFTEAQKRYGIIKALCIHRVGALAIGDRAVWIGASCAHREEAFAACRYIIDEVKKRLPIWKKESYLDQSVSWVDQSSSLNQSSSEEEYCSKQSKLPEFNSEIQQRLKETKVLVIGAGGLGCSALMSLAQAGVGYIGIAEYDKVDLSNLSRQSLYRFEDIGISKAETAAVEINKINPFITVIAHPIKVNADNIRLLSADYSFVLDCSDDFSLKQSLRSIVPQLSKTLIQASVYQYEGQLSVVFPKSGEAISSSVDSCSTGTCQDSGVLGVVPQVFGHLQALEVIKIICNLKPSFEDHTTIINLLTLETRKITEVNMPKDEVNPKHSLEVQWDQIQNLKGKKIFVDVREDAEIAIYPVDEIATVHLPLSQYTDGIYSFHKDTAYIIFCAHGMRSYALAERLSHQGAQNVYSLTGGYDALKAYLKEKQRV